MILRLPPHHPGPTSPVYDYTVDVAGVVLRYRLEFFARRGSWTMSLWADGVELFSGVRLVEGRPIGWRLRLTPVPVPDGVLMLNAIAQDHAELETQDGLGWTHELLWADAADLNSPTIIPLTIT